MRVKDNPDSMEAREKMSEHQLKWHVIWKVWLICGTVFLILTGGFPWTSTGMMDAVMGRRVPLSFFERLIVHYGIAFIYTVLLSWVVYRFRPLPGILLGVLFGVTILYGLNYFVFREVFRVGGSTEPNVFLIHLVFSSIASAMYKGMAISRIRKEPEGRGQGRLKHA
jgi:hypothetical protein